MSNISFNRYVRIDSGVIGAGGTRQRDLIGRLFTTNALLGANDVLEFSSPTEVSEMFGANSEEFRRAQFYFGWVSPRITKARKISFARFFQSSAPGYIYGGRANSLSEIVAQSGGTLEVIINGTTYSASNIILDESSISSYADVASIIQSAIQGIENAPPELTDATVNFSSGSRSFILTTGTQGAVTVGLTETPLSEPLGWRAPSQAAGSTRFVDGAVAEQPSTAILRADGISNNYATVEFVTVMGLPDHQDAARTLQSLGSVTYLYCMPVVAESAQEWAEGMREIAGVAMTLVTTGNDYASMIPMIQIAATDYSRVNATSSYMFRSFDTPVSVDNDADANTYDRLRVNYYGRTQTAGTRYTFYQRGVLMGGATAPVDQNVYANEIWLKDYAGVQFMNLLQGLAELPADATGITYGMNTLQGVVEAALSNGSIAVGKELSDTQKAAVDSLSGVEDSWRQVQNIGYWFNVDIDTTVSPSGVTEYVLKYLLIYAKKDTIRSVEGRHALV